MPLWPVGTGNSLSDTGLGFDPADGFADEGGGVLGAELFLEAGAVGLDGLDGEVEATGDLAGAEALTDELEDLEFSVAEGADGAFGSVGVGSCVAEGLEDPGRDGRADVDLALEDGADGLHDGAAAGGLHEVPTGAGTDGTFGVEGFVVHGQDEGGDPGVLGGHVLEQLEAIATREAEVGDDEVGAEGLDGGKGGGNILGLADHAEVGLIADHDGEALARDGMIIHEEDAMNRSRFGLGLVFHGTGRRHGNGRGGRCR